MARAGIEIETANGLWPDARADVVLFQHHCELHSDAEVRSLAASSPAPVVLFAHSPGAGALSGHVDGIVAMCPGMIGPTDKPVHVFPHPAWTPARLEDRPALRRDLGMPDACRIAGTSGYLRFERQFAEIAAALVTEAWRHDWFVLIAASPWRLQSPGLIPRLARLQRRFPDHFRFEYAFLDSQALNRRLQACDLLWCWTDAPSAPYASGSVSDHYASGTRVFVADKQQHDHVLHLPNAVAGPATLDAFLEGLIAEIHSGNRRHDPTAVSWDRCIDQFAAFLSAVAA
ncbi:MAG: hypothetical protein L0271_04860 [Gemmatimonadetes bacterium]|nr:hypothetical protein [Gemmatimonadota bacterium]